MRSRETVEMCWSIFCHCCHRPWESQWDGVTRTGQNQDVKCNAKSFAQPARDVAGMFLQFSQPGGLRLTQFPWCISWLHQFDEKVKEFYCDSGLRCLALEMFEFSGCKRRLGLGPGCKISRLQPTQCKCRESTYSNWLFCRYTYSYTYTCMLWTHMKCMIGVIAPGVCNYSCNYTLIYNINIRISVCQL